MMVLSDSFGQDIACIQKLRRKLFQCLHSSSVGSPVSTNSLGMDSFDSRPSRPAKSNESLFKNEIRCHRPEAQGVTPVKTTRGALLQNNLIMILQTTCGDHVQILRDWSGPFQKVQRRARGRLEHDPRIMWWTFLYGFNNCKGRE